MKYDENTLKRIWNTELEILDVLHNVCVGYELKYSLAFGTLIGLVRHGGFIPWDDDIDIIMPRKDYDTLIEIWEKTAPKDYIIQYKDKDEDFEQNFIKIRKNNTTFLQDETEGKKKYHKGIFIDIAPCDKVPLGKIPKHIQYVACAIELLYSKEHTSGTKGVIGVIEKIMLIVPKKFRSFIRKKARRIVTKWNSGITKECFCTDTIQNCKRYFPVDIFDNLNLVSFQQRTYFAIEKPDDFLKVRYGDYMKLPPAEERVWKHHPLIIDFEHNYEDLI